MRVDPGTHRVLDFVTAFAFAVAPLLLGLVGLAAGISYALAAVHLTLTVLTRFTPTSSAPVPYRIHLIIELVVGLALLALPFAFGWEGAARVFYLVVGAGILVLRALSASEPAALRRAP